MTLRRRVHVEHMSATSVPIVQQNAEGVEVELFGTRRERRERTQTGKLRWKPWPDLVVAILGFLLIGSWLVWVLWMLAAGVFTKIFG